ncbi:hypothetical protein [Streptomyces albipurpureus]|uniref:Uncharacterized protein n=1 Tax=Streptomyces albipurpureus TaxID=2897419 RepID=A0ABT0USH9_9ACTN|nr:hypothetical protein [Streptomyces sp. CWNU-1]MCM2390191.1 hypothetical protein [Streptomyces sp. CWNU-1]
MRIRIISVTSVADGAGHRYESGQVVHVPDGLAQAWITAGHARPATHAARKADTPPSPARAEKRTAVRPPPTTDTKPPPPRKRAAKKTAKPAEGTKD